MATLPMQVAPSDGTLGGLPGGGRGKLTRGIFKDPINWSWINFMRRCQIIKMDKKKKEKIKMLNFIIINFNFSFNFNFDFDFNRFI